MIKRLLDIFLVLIPMPIFAPLVILTFLLVKLSSKGPALFWSDRVGINNKIFRMPKFRSMLVNTPQLATHVLNQQGNADSYLTPVGNFIRKTSLDELPQLWSVFIGDMSIVGPRPALFNQDDLIHLRTAYNIHTIKPGITGWAQVNGRDEIPIPQKVELDVYYLNNQSLVFDIKIILLTCLKVINREGVTH